MPNIPRFSTDLIDQLDGEVGRVHFPMTPKGAEGLTQAEVRRGIWFAARRALVDELITAREEDNEGAEDNPSSSSEDARDLLNTPVLDPSGGARLGMASAYMVPTSSSADDADASEQ